MRALRSNLAALIFISAFFTFLSCDNGENDSGDDAQTEPDDDTDLSDDVADDTSGGEDDDTVTVDWSREPLAVLVCDSNFTDPDSSVGFDGTGSSDPNSRPLTFHLDFGDGETVESATATHAFSDPGAFRVSLTVTNDEGFSDATFCIIQVGEFPSEPGDPDGVGFRLNFFNDEIIEPGSDPNGGGVIYAFFRSPDAAAADTVLVDGKIGDPSSADVEWCEVIQGEVVPEEIGLVQCHSYSADFSPGNPISLEVRAGDASLWNFTGNIPAQILSPSFITSSVAGDELLIYVRNDGDAACSVTGLSIDGLDVSDFAVIENAELLPGEISLIRVPRHDGIDFGVFHVFTVRGSDGRGDLSASRIHRVFPPVFPVGNWDSGDDNVFQNMENLDKQLDHGVDMHIYYPSDENPPDMVVPLAEEKDFYLFTHYDGADAAYEQYISEYGDNPQVLANAVFGEPDLNDSAVEMLPRMQLQRSLWGVKKPLWGYNACANRWPAFQPLPDIGGMDHYCVFAPKCNYNWPSFYWDHLWFEGYYAESAKRNAEPKPVWDWTQGNSWGDLYLFNRCLTDEEIRAQWYVLIGRGVKGMLWFRFTEEWAATCPGPLPSMKVLAHELESVKPFLLEGEWFTSGLYATTPDQTVDAQVTIGPRGAVIVLSNFHYDLNLVAPWVWHEKINLTVEFTPPAGFEPAAFQLAKDTDLLDLEWRKVSEGRWRFTLPSLTVAEMILVTPEP